MVGISVRRLQKKRLLLGVYMRTRGIYLPYNTPRRAHSAMPDTSLASDCEWGSHQLRLPRERPAGCVCSITPILHQARGTNLQQHWHRVIPNFQLQTLTGFEVGVREHPFRTIHIAQHTW